ncbi:MAG: hypothetical protein ACO3RV_00420 [Luteolibacter sp.]
MASSQLDAEFAGILPEQLPRKLLILWTAARIAAFVLGIGVCPGSKAAILAAVQDYPRIRSWKASEGRKWIR